MVNMTLAIPEELHKTMKQHPEIKWTEVVRFAIKKKAVMLEGEEQDWKIYAQKHAVKKGWSEAHELFEF